MLKSLIPTMGDHQHRLGVFLLPLLLCLVVFTPLLAADNPPEDIIIAIYHEPYGYMIYVIISQGNLNPEQKGRVWWPVKEFLKLKDKEKSKDEAAETDKI